MAEIIMDPSEELSSWIDYTEEVIQEIQEKDPKTAKKLQSSLDQVKDTRTKGDQQKARQMAV